MSTELAYMAGFFDGEGSLGVWKTGRGYGYFSMQLTNTNRELVDLFFDRFGGSVTTRSPNIPSNKLSKKTQYIWKAYSEKAWDAYYALEPYLREKRWKGEPQG